MQTVIKPKEAPHRGASFVSRPVKNNKLGISGYLFGCLLAMGSSGPSTALASDVCHADYIDEYARVAYVYDGDTLRLEDGRRIRLIGINTPERRHDDRPPEPYAEEAYKALKSLLASSPRVGLRLDKERHDHYRRVLAHLYTEDHRSIEAWMLERGYGAQIIESPNLWGRECYYAAEQRARVGKKGIWALPYYRPLETATLAPGATGFRFVAGRVEKVTETRKSFWLELDGGFGLRIDRSDLKYFENFKASQWNNRRIMARGWIYQYGNSARMRIRHPDALEVLK